MTYVNEPKFRHSYLALEDVREIIDLLEEKYAWVRVRRDMEETARVNAIPYDLETTDWGDEEWADAERYVRFDHYLENGKLCPEGFDIAAGPTAEVHDVVVKFRKQVIYLGYDSWEAEDDTSYHAGQEIEEVMGRSLLQPRYLTARLYWIAVALGSPMLGGLLTLAGPLFGYSMAVGLNIFRRRLPRIHLVERAAAIEARGPIKIRAIGGGVIFGVAIVLLFVWLRSLND